MWNIRAEIFLHESLRASQISVFAVNCRWSSCVARRDVIDTNQGHDAIHELPKSTAHAGMRSNHMGMHRYVGAPRKIQHATHGNISHNVCSTRTRKLNERILFHVCSISSISRPHSSSHTLRTKGGATRSLLQHVCTYHHHTIYLLQSYLTFAHMDASLCCFTNKNLACIIRYR